jgi:hypothetical protein
VAVKLNRKALEHAKELVNEGRVVLDERDAWSEHQPSTQRENEFIEAHGFAGYGQRHLGIDDEAGENMKRTFKFPYEDFKNPLPSVSCIRSAELPGGPFLLAKRICRIKTIP